MRVPRTPAGKQLSWYLDTLNSDMRRLTVDGLVLDYGFVRGGDYEFEQLLRAW
jgi:hypothetical protein